MELGKLLSNLQPGIALVLKCLIRLRSNTLISKKGPSNKYTRCYSKEQAIRGENKQLFEFLVEISVYTKKEE